MISEKHIFYLFKDVIQLDVDILSNIKIAIDNDFISVQYKKQLYKEPVFNFSKPQITDSELSGLIRTTKSIAIFDNNQNRLTETLNHIESPCLLKFIHFFINEHYFDFPLKSDSHGRTTFDSVNHNYKKILEYPITDILISALLKRLDIAENPTKKFIFTCDYDIINIWNALGWPVGVFKRLAKRIVKLNPITFIKELYSVLFSNYMLHANYMLNTGMYYMDLESTHTKLSSNIEVERIAFFLIDYTHKAYDINNNFNTRSFKSFEQLLRKNKVKLALHPSYETISTPDLLNKQVHKFKSLFNQAPDLSRFHFLHCNYPQSLPMLEAAAIKTDYSLYFTETASVFRCGTSRKFKMWNDEQEQPFDIDLVPISIMECSLDQYMGLAYDDALTTAKSKIWKTFIFGQNVCLLWHNTQIYYGQTESDNYQYRLFKELKTYISQLIKYA